MCKISQGKDITVEEAGNWDEYLLVFYEGVIQSISLSGGRISGNTHLCIQILYFWAYLILKLRGLVGVMVMVLNAASKGLGFETNHSQHF